MGFKMIKTFRSAFALLALAALAACASDPVKPGAYETAFCADRGGVETAASPAFMGGMFPTVCKNGASTRFASTGGR